MRTAERRTKLMTAFRSEMLMGLLCGGLVAADGGGGVPVLLSELAGTISMIVERRPLDLSDGNSDRGLSAMGSATT